MIGVLPLPGGLGIASTSFMGASLGRRSTAPDVDTAGVLSLPPTADTLQLLELSHELGAGGIQCQVSGDPRKLRERAEELGMWIEAMISIRQSSAHQLDGLLGGRRYETFTSLGEWNDWASLSLKQLEAAIPVFEKHRFTLALENHKDWTTDEYVALFRKYSSEYLGACLDFGNNLALLDDPMDTIAAVAPFTKATHLKDIAISPDRHGFLLAEVPLGAGIIDLPKAVELILSANRQVRFSLEMITRDPLLVPCLTDRYWATFPERQTLCLAPALRFVNKHQCATPLDMPEELSPQQHADREIENIKACLAYTRAF
jgi:sugar phosphate isomerase/epimerase